MVDRHTPVELTLDQCLKCNICTTACPISAVTDLFPGPKYEGPQAGRFRAPGQLSPDHSVDYCSGCRVCNMVCPAGVKIAEMNARARAAIVESGRMPVLLRLRNNLVARAALLGQVAQPVAPLANAFFGFGPARWLAEKVLSIHRKAPFPPFTHQRFTTWFTQHQRQGILLLPQRGSGGNPDHDILPSPQRGRWGNNQVRGINQGWGNNSSQVVYFHGCSTEYYEPRVGRAAVRVLEANGFEVIVPQQNCCGLPLLSNGEFPAALRYHQGNVRSLVEFARRGIPIVGTSTSCTLTLKEEAPELLDMHDEDTRLVAQSTYDFNEFLGLLLEEGSLVGLDNLRPIPLTLGYHVPCQYRAHRLGRPGVEVLDLIPELRIVESNASCCGIAGTYGYKKEKYDIAMQVGQPLFDFVRGMSSPLVVCDSETCRWQITHATGIPCVHPVELLAAAYGFEPEGALAEALSLIPSS